MSKTSFNLLRAGLAITFIWIGVMILKSPESFGGYLQPWAVKLLPVSLAKAMIGTAWLDIVIGILFLFRKFVWLGALLGALHLAAVLTASGITDITVRDIGLLSAAAAVFLESRRYSRRY